MNDFVIREYSPNSTPQDGNGSVKKQSKTECNLPLNLLRQITSLATTLASKGCYDQYGKLIYRSKPINGSDIVDLLCIAMSEDVNHKGIDEFIHVLRDAQVSPSLIVNKMIKKKLTVTPIKRKKPANITNPVVFPNLYTDINHISEETKEEQQQVEPQEKVKKPRKKKASDPDIANRVLQRIATLRKRDILLSPEKKDVKWIKPTQ